MPDLPNPGALLTPGSRLGRYRIDALLGVGGMGAVFRAQDTTLERPLAIKVLHADVGDRDAKQRLLREARSASALNHPNICTVYEVGEEAGRAFIAMEYVDGPSLTAQLMQGPLAVRDAVQYGIDVADALAHAHGRKVVHRDLKAGNAMLSSTGRLKLVDFGLARRIDPLVVDASTRGTIVPYGAAVGTPYAMAPEQVRGEPADERSDVWALGVLLFEMLTAAHPFASPVLAELFTAILRDPYEPLLHTRVPARLRTVIETCLTKDAGRRFQRAEDVRLALQEIAQSSAASRSRSGAPTAAPAGTPLQRPLLLERASGEFVLVGRERERSQLEEVWTRAKHGRRQLLLLAGEPGIGKTRLSLELARTCADEHATVLVGRCDEEALIPYQPFVEALSWFARACPDADLHAALAAAGGGGELGPFVTDFLVRVPDLPPPTPMNAQGQRYRLFETVNSLLAAASKVFPVLLFIDDLHWADKPTLSLLRHIVRGSDPAALCIVGTYRESELGMAHPLTELLADLRRERDVTRLSLTGLERSQVGQMVEALASPDVSSMLAGQMTDNTGGNPFFVGEMLRHLRETGALTAFQNARPSQLSGPFLELPEGVREVISRRVSRLSEGCNRAMTLASVLGRQFDLDVLEAFGDLSEDQLLDAVDEARRAQLVDEVPGRPGRYSFHHALIRDTVYGGLAALRRVRLHRRAGEALERLTAGETAPPLADLAHHFVQAAPTGVADKAADYATRAGDRMADALAHEEAARFYDLALLALDSLPSGTAIERQRVGLQRRRGRAFGNLGQWAQQRAALEKALVHLGAEAPEERCEILFELSQACFWLFDIPSLERTSTEALSLAERLGREDLAANSMGWLARCRQADGGGLLDAIEMDRVTIARFGSAAQVSHSIGAAALYWAGRGTQAVAVAAQAAHMAETSQDATFTMNALSHYAINLAAVGRYAEAIGVFARAQEFGRKYGALPLLARVTSMSAGFRLSLGDLDGAEAIQREARELAQKVNFPPSIVSPGIDLLLIAARRGDPGSVEKLFEETVAASKRTPGWHGWLWDLRICQVRAELAFARGEWEGARFEATEGIGQSRMSGRRKYEALGLMTRAQAMQRLGRIQEAVVDATQSVAVARSTEDPALLLQALDLLLQIEGDDALAAEARDTHRRILDELPDDNLRRRVGEWEVARRIQKL
jgi:tetratricopeptide (TPR) repeat protein/DNA polymerase III delta prime subunit